MLYGPPLEITDKRLYVSSSSTMDSDGRGSGTAEVAVNNLIDGVTVSDNLINKKELQVCEIITDEQSGLLNYFDDSSTCSLLVARARCAEGPLWGPLDSRGKP